jgi:hypothetical protein
MSWSLVWQLDLLNTLQFITARTNSSRSDVSAVSSAAVLTFPAGWRLSHNSLHTLPTASLVKDSAELTPRLAAIKHQLPTFSMKLSGCLFRDRCLAAGVYATLP